MGNYYTVNDSSITERDTFGFNVHIQAEETESWGQRESWERIQASYCGIDVGQQMYVSQLLTCSSIVEANIISFGRQHVHEQDLG